ncbi:MAG: septum formation initiator family protein [Kiritimatiellia bacterium]
MQEGFKDKVLRVFTVVLVLGIIVVGLVSVWPTYVRSRALKREEADLAERIEKKRREIEELKTFQRRYRTDSAFVEKIARQNHRVFPGELVFIFDDD